MNFKNLVIPLFFIINCNGADDTVRIPKASYLIYDDSSEIIGGVSAKSKYVTFYSFDGNLLAKLEHKHQFELMKAKLDPAAPRPQAVTYKIKYWPGVQLGWGMVKGQPGNFIIFYDKNGNRIESFRYEKKEGLITTSYEPAGKNTTCKLEDLKVADKKDKKSGSGFSLDLSEAKEQE